MVLESKYKYAISLFDAGKYEDAIAAFKALDGYKDSDEKASESYIANKTEEFRNTPVGGHVLFGSYEQDNTLSNGKELIEWIILAKENNRALVISKYSLDCQEYNSEFVFITWETCTLRKWLNSTFLQKAFSHEEQQMILSTDVMTASRTDISSHNNSKDNVFLLNFTEAELYFGSNMSGEATAYAKAKGAGEYWWLRNDKSNNAAYVYNGKDLGVHGLLLKTAVRPAMWINLQ